MALSYAARRKWAMFILVIALPVYIVVALNAVSYATALWGRPSILLELAIYVGLGIIWALPLKKIFKGIGQADPNAPKKDAP